MSVRWMCIRESDGGLFLPSAAPSAVRLVGAGFQEGTVGFSKMYCVSLRRGGIWLSGWSAVPGSLSPARLNGVFIDWMSESSCDPVTVPNAPLQPEL